MPMYEFKCGCGNKETLFRGIHEEGDPPRCPGCTAAMTRDYQAEGSGIRPDYRKPIEMHSIALCNDDDIAAFKRRNPSVEIGTDPNGDDYGVPVAHNRAEKLSILKKEGYEEKN